MSFFSRKNTGKRFGVIIDIGSGSVLAAIVRSDPKKAHPDVIWSHREHVPLRDAKSLDQREKAVMTSLVSSTMLLDSEGRKVLSKLDSSATLTVIQCSISAPWSYTVSKTINYRQDKPFNITAELIKDLHSTIDSELNSDLKQDEKLHALGLKIITKSTMNLSANGYNIPHLEGGKTTTLALSQANVVAQQYLINAIDELREKLFPKTKIFRLSFILMLYATAQDLLSQPNDVCLIDITYEATEIGIVRDKILKYCTHAPVGSFSLAREISRISGVPLQEAFGYLHTEKPYSFLDTLPEIKKAEIRKVFEDYIEEVSKLFKETGDSLTIPKYITIHTDIKAESLFIDLIENAAMRNLRTKPIITTISKMIVDKTYKDQTKSTNEIIPTDTAMLLSARFFHTQGKHNSFKYLTTDIL